MPQQYPISALGPMRSGGLLAYLMSSNVMGEFVGPAVVSIDGGELSSNVVPLALGVPGHADLRVMEEGHDDKPRGEHPAGHGVVRDDCIEPVRTEVPPQHRQGRRAARNGAHTSRNM